MSEHSRGRVKRKYSVDRSRGPLVLVAELLEKRLIMHCWPCAYDYSEVGDVATFKAARYRTIGPDFDRALEIAARVLSDETGARIALDGRHVFLDGPHYIGSDGYPKYGKRKADYDGDDFASWRYCEDCNSTLCRCPDRMVP